MLYNIEGALDPAVTEVDIAHAKMPPRRARRHADRLRRRRCSRRWPPPTLLASRRHRGRGHRSARACARSTPRPSSPPWRKTRRAVIVDEGWNSGSLAAEIGMRIVEEAFFDLDAPLAPGLRRARCRCPMRRIWKTPPCRSRPASSPRRAASCVGAHERLPHAGARRRHGGRHARRVADQAGRPGQARRHRRGRRDPKGRHRGRDLRRRRDRLRVRRAGRHQGPGRRPCWRGSTTSAATPPAPAARRLPAAVARRAAAVASRPPLRQPRRPRRGAAVPVSPAAKVTPAARAARRRARHRPRPASPAPASTARSASPMSKPPRRRDRPPGAGKAAPRRLRPGRDAQGDRRRDGRSKREIPHYYLSHTVDLGAALAWLEGVQRRRSRCRGACLPAALLLKASALALREVPQLNGTYADGAFRPGESVHPGWAISLRGGGLVAPAIRDADSHPLARPDGGNARPRAARPQRRPAQLRACHRRQSPSPASASAAPRASPASSTRRRSRSSASARLRPGRGWSTERSTPRPLVMVGLAADHRVTDGHIGACLLTAIERLLQEPARL